MFSVNGLVAAALLVSGAVTATGSSAPPVRPVNAVFLGCTNATMVDALGLHNNKHGTSDECLAECARETYMYFNADMRTCMCTNETGSADIVVKSLSGNKGDCPATAYTFYYKDPTNLAYKHCAEAYTNGPGSTKLHTVDEPMDCFEECDTAKYPGGMKLQWREDGKWQCRCYGDAPVYSSKKCTSSNFYFYRAKGKRVETKPKPNPHPEPETPENPHGETAEPEKPKPTHKPKPEHSHKPKPEHSHKPKPEHSHKPKPEHSEKPKPTHSKPEHSHKPKPTHSKPEHSHKPPKPTHSKPEHSHKPPKPTHSKPEHSHKPPKPTHSKPEHSHKPPKPTHTKPEHSHTKPEHSHTKPEHSHSKPPKPTQTKPEHSHTKPEHSHTKPEHSHTKPEHSHTKPEHSHTKPEHSHTKPEPTHTKPEHSHTKPEHSHTKPEHSHTKPPHTHTPKPTPSKSWHKKEHDRRAAAAKRMYDENPLCPAGWSPCAVGNIGYECVDTSSELQFCGGCPTGLFSINGRAGGVSGEDCTQLPGALRTHTQCTRGECIVTACRSGWNLVSGRCVRVLTF